METKTLTACWTLMVGSYNPYTHTLPHRMTNLQRQKENVCSCKLSHCHMTGALMNHSQISNSEHLSASFPEFLKMMENVQ